ncbi:MAG: hypothetical protein AAF747_00505, partial [Planctomycetota bacterium]
MTEAATKSKKRRWRRTIGRAVVVLLVLHVVAAFVITRSPITTSFVQSILADQLGGRVDLASARVNLTGGVVLKGLEVRADGVPKSAERVFAIERAEADLNWW